MKGFQIILTLAVITFGRTLASSATFEMVGDVIESDNCSTCKKGENMACKKMTGYDPTSFPSVTSLTLPNGVTYTRTAKVDDEGLIGYTFLNGSASINLDVMSKGLYGDATGSGKIYLFDTCYENDGSASYLMSEKEHKIPTNPFLFQDKCIYPNVSLAKNKALQEELRNKGINSNEMANISVKIYYTDAFEKEAKNYSMVKEIVDLNIAYMNKALKNSQVMVHINLHCIEKISYTATDDQVKLTYENHKGSMSELFDGADIVHLLIARGNNTYSGSASTNPLNPTGNTNDAALVDEIAQGIFQRSFTTFSHELGHNFGALHNAKISNDTVDLPIYARGYNLPGTDNATIMSYGSDTHVNIIPNYSNPNVSVSGHATGTNEASNARVMNMNRFIIAAIGNETACTNTVYPINNISEITCK